MMKDMKNKAMKAEDAGLPVCLKCVVECWAPGLGAFNVGDIVSNAELVKKLAGNPNFKEISEEA